MRVYCKSG